VILLLSVGGCGEPGDVSRSTAPQAPIQDPEENASMDDVPPAVGPTGLECGKAMPEVSGGGLTLTGTFPSVISSAEHLLSGTVEVASAGDGVRGVVTPTADVVLVRDGLVATLPVAQDSVGMEVELGPGRVQQLVGQASLAACDPRSGGLPVQPGAYEVYVRVVLTGDDGSVVESVGGPWPLEVT